MTALVAIVASSFEATAEILERLSFFVLLILLEN